MSCDSNDDELKLTKEYKFLLSYIRPLIDQLDKSKDAQLCLLWLSKLEQCSIWERNYRNRILSELCKQVKSNCLKHPFNVSPPSGPLRNIICGEWRGKNCVMNECSEADVSTEDIISSSSLHSFNSVNNSKKHQPLSGPWKEGYLCNNAKNKMSSKTWKESVDHSDCFAIQNAYRERADGDQMVIDRYQGIIKSLVSQQLKADISPSRLKKLQSTYEGKMSELMHSLKRAQEENEILRRKIAGLADDLNKLEDVKTENESLRKHVYELEAVRSSLEENQNQVEEENALKFSEFMTKLSETEKKLNESEKRCKLLQEKSEEIYELEYQNQANEREKEHLAKLSGLEKQIQRKEMEINNLKEQLTNQCNRFEEEVSQLRIELAENSHMDKNKKKIKALKSKIKKLEKVQEHMSVLFQSQLQQILAKKDFYITSLEMQLKMYNSDYSFGSDFNDALNQKVSNLETQYRKLLEDSEQQSLKRRQLDLQKIHSLEKQLLMYGGMADEAEPSLDQLKTDSLTSASGPEDDFKSGGNCNGQS